jgi:hypothetical protein
MEDEVAMYVSDGFAELQHEVDGRRDGGCGIVADGVNAEAVDVLHDDVGNAFVDSAVQETRDIGMMKLGKGFAFEQELPDGGGRAEMAGDDLDGYRLLEVSGGALTEVDDAHTAVAEDALDAEWAEKAAEPGISLGCVGVAVRSVVAPEEGLRIGRRGWCVEKFFNGGVGLKQGEEFGEQIGIGGAPALGVFGTLRRWIGEGSVEELFEAVQAFGGVAGCGIDRCGVH